MITTRCSSPTSCTTGTSPPAHACCKSAHGALPAGGRIFIHEALLDDSGAGPLTTATFSLVMLLGTQGRQFTYAELAKLLGDAGFTDVGATPSHGYYSVVRATRR